VAPTPGHCCHHTLKALYDATGQILTTAPPYLPDAAQAFAATFVQHPIAYRVL